MYKRKHKYDILYIQYSDHNTCKVIKKNKNKKKQTQTLAWVWKMSFIMDLVKEVATMGLAEICFRTTTLCATMSRM